MRSAAGRMDVWVYPSKNAALKAGAASAMDRGLDEDLTARKHFTRAASTARSLRGMKSYDRSITCYAYCPPGYSSRDPTVLPKTEAMTTGHLKTSLTWGGTACRKPTCRTMTV